MPARLLWSRTCPRNTSARSSAVIASVAAGSAYISTMYGTMYGMPPPWQKAAHRGLLPGHFRPP
ncbi:hypothetical protein [Actinacidiphila glaucinigra]|uniref:hypothetical protein n=1 Tax=Actinacidiphila glaucinigra TaxID=235986 RepID=UPI003D8B5661